MDHVNKEYNDFHDLNDTEMNQRRSYEHPEMEKHNLNCIDKIRQTCGLIVENKIFQTLVIILIIINSIMMGLATFDFVTSNVAVANFFETVDLMFLIIFTVELAMHFVFRGTHLFSNGWLVFDLFVIAFSWSFASMKIIRAFRIVRAMGLISRVEEMRDLVTALLNSTSRIFAVGLLLLLFFYIFGVMFTQLFSTLYEDGYTDQDYFSRLDRSFFTLFQLMTLDSWSYVTKQIMQVYPWAWAPVLVFILISSFVVVNLVIAVICDAVSDVNKAEFEEQILHINSAVSEKNESEIRALQDKVDKLTIMVEKLLKEHGD